jgi:hypothetical protein
LAILRRKKEKRKSLKKVRNGNIYILKMLQLGLIELVHGVKTTAHTPSTLLVKPKIGFVLSFLRGSYFSLF